jgi:hypothetical protein
MSLEPHSRGAGGSRHLATDRSAMSGQNAAAGMKLPMRLKELLSGLSFLRPSTRGASRSSPVRVAIAVGCVLVGAAAVGCSSRSLGGIPSTVAPLPATSAIQGIGATRAKWDASHTPNWAKDNGSAYGDDPSLPSYLTDNGAVYSEVDDQGTGRIQTYNLNLHTVEPDGVLLRVRQELPSDATVAWDLTFDQCYLVAFNSPTLQAAGHYMTDAQLEYIQEDGTRATSPDRFNHASLWLGEAGSPPPKASDVGCGERRNP